MQLGRAQDSFDAHSHDDSTRTQDAPSDHFRFGPLSPTRPLENTKRRKRIPQPVFVQDDDQPPLSARLGHKTNSRPPIFPRCRWSVFMRLRSRDGLGIPCAPSSRTFEYQLSSVLFPLKRRPLHTQDAGIVSRIRLTCLTYPVETYPTTIRHTLAVVLYCGT